jgi:hypothetical protein
MPTRKVIARHHGLGDGVCWRCGFDTDDIERAHIVDRMTWPGGAGLDAVQNLALLCGVCHKGMPIIEPEDWERGMEYVGLARIRAAFDRGVLPVDPPPYSARMTRWAQERMRQGATVGQLLRDVTADDEAGAAP